MRLLTASLLVLVAAGAEPPAGYHLVKTVSVPGEGGWDYVSVDEAGRRVYLSHGTKVDVLDADTCEVKGTIPDTRGVHGIAVAPDLGRGFTSNGRTNNVTVFDLKTLKPIGEVKTGRGPDSIIYDPATKRVFAFNGGGKSTTIIDGATEKVVATLELGGQPEFAVSDGQGHVFVNLEDKGELLKLDAEKPAVLERWSLAPGKIPTGLAIDRRNHRLFVGCRSKQLEVVDAETGKVVAALPIGTGVDAAFFDPQTNLIFASCGDGTVSVIRQESADKYVSEGVLNTRPRSKTMALDPKTHRLFIPAAEFGPTPAATADNPRPRPQIIPGKFTVLVYEK
jgi:DNA-binding beta-propeller fold protein YncE